MIFLLISKVDRYLLYKKLGMKLYRLIERQTLKKKFELNFYY